MWTFTAGWSRPLAIDLAANTTGAAVRPARARVLCAVTAWPRVYLLNDQSPQPDFCLCADDLRGHCSRPREDRRELICLTSTRGVLITGLDLTIIVNGPMITTHGQEAKCPRRFSPGPSTASGR